MDEKLLKKIATRIKISEAFDQSGFHDDAQAFIVDAFELVENSIYEAVANLNTMQKTASVQSQNQIDEIENMLKVANIFKAPFRWIGRNIGEKMMDWGAKKPGLLRELGSKTGRFITKHPGKVGAGLVAGGAGLASSLTGLTQRNAQDPIIMDNPSLDDVQPEMQPSAMQPTVQNAISPQLMQQNNQKTSTALVNFEQRVNNLERVINQIKQKVGV